MDDGSIGIRHYSESGTQCGKMWELVKAPDLNILDCIWVSPDSLAGYPASTTYRANTLVAGIDPVALDYYGSKHIGGPRLLRQQAHSLPARRTLSKPAQSRCRPGPYHSPQRCSGFYQCQWRDSGRARTHGGRKYRSSIGLSRWGIRRRPRHRGRRREFQLFYYQRRQWMPLSKVSQNLSGFRV
jgi:hypothetical protein